MKIGQRIKELRVLNNMTQEDLGKRIGSNKHLISKYESGKITNIPYERLSQIANVFSLTVGELTEQDDEKIWEMNYYMYSKEYLGDPDDEEEPFDEYGTEACIQLFSELSLKYRKDAILFLEFLNYKQDKEEELKPLF